MHPVHPPGYATAVRPSVAYILEIFGKAKGTSIDAKNMRFAKSIKYDHARWIWTHRKYSNTGWTVLKWRRSMQTIMRIGPSHIITVRVLHWDPRLVNEIQLRSVVYKWRQRRPSASWHWSSSHFCYIHGVTVTSFCLKTTPCWRYSYVAAV